MRVGSLFSGGGGFDLGFHAAGFETVFFCEIDPTAREVLARHWPEVPCYEDITKLDPAALPRVDVLIGGFPCQDVSVAGNRAGLAGERTGLFWEFARVIDGLRPTWLVLENVPGLLSSNGTEDMGAVLWALGELGYGWAYRVLDAQHWGVPQRRRRVFIVGRAGGLVDRAAQVLFESEGSGGDSPKGGEAGQGAAGGATAGARLASTIKAGLARCWNDNEGNDNLIVADTVRSHPRPGSNSVGNLTVGTLCGGEGYDGQNAGSGQLVVGSLCGGGVRQLQAAASDQFIIAGPVGGGDHGSGRRTQDDPNLVIANTVQASAGHHGHSSPRGDGNDNLVVAHCLNGSQERLDGTVETFVTALAENQRGELRTADVSPALGAGGGKPGSGESAAWNGSTVRRLQPIECERLQGWPDGWTEGHADGARYRLIGNGVAAPVARWIAERILSVEAAPSPEAPRLPLGEGVSS